MSEEFDIFDLLAEYEMSETEQLFMGCLALYGVIEAGQLVQIILNYLDIHGKDSIDSFIDEFTSSPLVQHLQEEVEGEIYFTAPQVSDVRTILESRKELLCDSFKSFTKDEVMSAGEDPGLPIYNTWSDEGQDAIEMLGELGYDDEEIWVEMHYIWENSQFATSEETAEDLFGCVKDKQETLESFDSFRNCIDIIAQYANTLPKWLLGGYSADEREQLKITIKTDGDFNDVEMEPEKVTLRYNCAALCSSAPDKSCSWMIFWKDSAEQKGRRQIAS